MSSAIWSERVSFTKKSIQKWKVLGDTFGEIFLFSIVPVPA
ncbi:MAG TPA: hypothetical protein VHZ55_02770 [Bryobacteraceae bacterium]|nr:hypothetical protein [Bryobacteraceae bacterium]